MAILDILRVNLMNNTSLNIQKGIKRALDLTFSFLILILFLPLWLLVILLIKLDSPGSVFFLDKRPGFHLQFFYVYKFRTMWQDAEKTPKGQEVMLDDERITRIGRFLRRYKIDEVPQLLNVIKGEMSLVGPRPEAMANLLGYNEDEFKRFRIKPGITGLAQVNGNIYISLEERHKYDVYYIENFSLWLDFKIIIRTIGVVLFGEQKFVRDKKGEIWE
jgi:undecaprenyl phosphate N,N'-diacetylbacillosamine 1-phosphate transferase